MAVYRGFPWLLLFSNHWRHSLVKGCESTSLYPSLSVCALKQQSRVYVWLDYGTTWYLCFVVKQFRTADTNSAQGMVLHSVFNCKCVANWLVNKQTSESACYDEWRFKLCCVRVVTEEIAVAWCKNKNITAFLWQTVIKAYSYFKNQVPFKSRGNLLCTSGVSLHGVLKQRLWRCKKGLGYTDFFRSAVRRRVHAFFIQNVRPVLNAVL